MDIFTKSASLSEALCLLKRQGRKIGFVPTMGSLHDGHLSLIAQAAKECDIVVVSIFVNPTQFNNSEDFKTYPKDLSLDCALLERQNLTTYLYAPQVEDVYPSDFEFSQIDLGFLDQVYEGANRPGHFNGVVKVVSRLLDIVQPKVLYLGQKDFQQVAVIEYMIKFQNRDTQIVICPTLREEDGLAMSSRNTLLSPEARKEVPQIYEMLSFIKNNKNGLPLSTLRQRAIDQINKSSFMKVEYLEIVNATTLMPETEVDSTKKIQILTAVQVGKVRLIDNLSL